MSKVILIKTAPATYSWGGNGFGSSRNARYAVKGAEHIVVKPFGSKDWMARDNKAGKCLATGTLAQIREQLSATQI